MTNDPKKDIAHLIEADFKDEEVPSIEYTEVFKCKNLEKIPVSKSPPEFNSPFQYLSPQEFSDSFGFEFQEGISATTSIADTFKKKWDQPYKYEDLTQQEKQILQRMNSPLDNLVVCHIDESVGYGLFAKSTIKKGTILGIYSGVMYDTAKDGGFGGMSDYRMDLVDTLKIDGKFLGGMMRFLQHLPTKEELEKFDFPPGIKESIATCNVALEIVMYRGIPIPILRAIEDIAPNRIIGFDYGPKYWNQLASKLFLQNGKLAPEKAFQNRDIVNSSIFHNSKTPVAPSATPISSKSNRKTKPG